MRNAHRTVVVKSEGKKVWETQAQDNIKIYLTDTGCEGLEQIELSQKETSVKKVPKFQDCIKGQKVHE